jgi:hypothetical protein
LKKYMQDRKEERKEGQEANRERKEDEEEKGRSKQKESKKKEISSPRLQVLANNFCNFYSKLCSGH